MSHCEECDQLRRENEGLRQALTDRQGPSGELADQRGDRSCTVSIAFDRRNTADKYKSAVQSFLQPICSQYTIDTDYLSSPQPCKFLLWVTFLGNGRLPDNMQRFTDYADHAESALVVTVKYINNEAKVPAIISGAADLASGVQLRTPSESRHILQLIVSGEVDGPKEYNRSSRVNAANQQLLVQLLQRLYVLESAQCGQLTHHKVGQQLDTHQPGPLQRFWRFWKYFFGKPHDQFL